MSRTTLDIDEPILTEVKRLQKQARKSLGATVTELLADALARRRAHGTKPVKFEWISKPLGERIDITDKEALWKILDEDIRKSQA